MAALLAGTHKILLTPVAFVVETLGGLFAIPALLASGISYLVSNKNSFYSLQPRVRLRTEELAIERFYLKAKTYAPQKLQDIKIRQFMTKTPVSIQQDTKVSAALDKFEGTKFRVLPIVDAKDQVVGVLHLEDLGYVDMANLNSSLPTTIIHKPIIIKADTSLGEAAQLMLDAQEDHLFVTDEADKLVGVVSGIDVVKKTVELLSSD